MTADSEQKGLPVFDNLSDIRAMEEFRDAYRNVFLGQEALTQSHREVPDWLAINHVKEPPKWLKFLDDKSVGYLPRQLAVSQLKPAHFDDVAESYTVSINQNLTASAIGLGLNYIDHVEQSAWNRKTWQPFEFIHRPAYYLITLISERVRDLCRFEPTKALVQEYRCLFLFLDRAVRIASDYFSTHEDVEPFHCYLSDVAYVVNQMKLRLEFYLERTAMAKNLENIANLLDSYRAGLAIYLAYAISDAPLNEAVHLGQLLPFKKKVRSEKAQTLPSEFRNSRIYRNINRVLEGKLDCIVNKTRVENKGVSALLKKSAEESERAQLAINNTLSAYHELLLSLSLLPELINGLRALSDGAKLRGEYEIVHDEALYATLEVQLTLAVEFLAQSSQRYDKINEQNRYALYGNENFQRGATLNIHSAESRSRRLAQIGRPILENRQAIGERIQKIQQLNPDTLKAQRNALIKRTNRLLTEFQRYAILPANELTELQLQLDKVYPQAVKENRMAFSRSMAVSASTAGKNAKLGNNNKQDSVTMPQASTQEDSHANSNNPYPFPEIYAVFSRHDHEGKSRQEFDGLMGILYAQVNELTVFLEKVEVINQKRIELEKALAGIRNIEMPLNEAHFTGINQLFKEMANDELRYRESLFNSFDFLQRIMVSQYVPARNGIIQKIKIILAAYDESVDGNLPYARRFLPKSQQLVNTIVIDLENRAAPLVDRIDAITTSVKQSGFGLSVNVIDHYHAAITEQYSKIAGTDNPSLEKPLLLQTKQSAIENEKTFSVTQSDKKLPVDDPIQPATRTEVQEIFKEFQTMMDVEKLNSLDTRADNKKSIQAQLTEKCNALFGEGITAEQLKSGLNGLVIFLLDINYYLHGGGEWVISPTAQKNKKVPYAIKLMAAQYTKRIAKINVANLEEMTKLRNELFEKISEAFENPPLYFCFYNPRDRQTQAIYRTMVDCFNAHKGQQHRTVAGLTP